MRKGRFELVIGLALVALVVFAACAAYNWRSFQAAWYRRQFLRGPKEDCHAEIGKMLRLGPRYWRHLADLVVTDSERLEILHRSEDTLTIRNNRPHRIFLNTMAGDLEELMSQLTRKDAEGPYHQAPLSEAVLFLTILEGRVLDPGEQIKITAPADREVPRAAPANPE